MSAFEYASKYGTRLKKEWRFRLGSTTKISYSASLLGQEKDLMCNQKSIKNLFFRSKLIRFFRMSNTL